MNTNELNNTSKLSSSALIVNLSISVWTGKKLDKSVSIEVDVDKNTKVRAGNYQKNLFAGSPLLEAVGRIASEARTWHYLMTQPWSDSGDRILNVSLLPEYQAQLDSFEEQFVDAVNNFLAEYTTMISTSAFTLGDLFDKNDYPNPLRIESKFGFKYIFSPVPTAGDFRIDIGEEGLRQLQEHYSNALDSRLQSAMQDAWDRVTKSLNHISERLTDSPDGKRKIFRDSLVDNAIELCQVLRHFNFSNDAKLEGVRSKLEGVIRGLDGEALRTSDELRSSTKKKIDFIRSEFGV